MPKLLRPLLFTLGMSALFTQAALPDKSTLQTTLTNMADWQITHFRDDYGRKHEWDNPINGWPYAAMYIGMERWADIAPVKRYYDFLLGVADENKWDLAKAEYHADDQAIGQLYLALYDKFQSPHMLEKTLKRTTHILENPSQQPMRLNNYKYTERWTWCDALFMAPPLWAKLANITGNKQYRDYMFAEYVATTNHLYDTEEHLFYRDEHFIGVKEHGRKIFWSRGNGWVFAGLALILEDMPDGPQKAYFETLFTEMAAALVKLQSKDGFWPMSLKAGDVYTTPETSGTGFFTFGLAWGINNGYLDSNSYLPAVEKGWANMTSHITETGMLGYVQPIGAAPGEAWPDKTEVYGVGAFLAAGSEIYKLENNTSK